MASLSRKFLSALNIDEGVADQIIERHNEVLTEVKDERDKLKDQVDKIPEMQKQLDEYKANEASAEKDPYKVKYEALKEEFDAFKADIDSKATAAKKETAYRKLLKDCGVAEKRIDAILKVTDLDCVEFDNDGNLSNGDSLSEGIKAEWSDFIQTASTEGAKMATPPTNNGGKTTMTKAEIRAITDPAARQKAMLENPTLFGLPESNAD